MPESTVRLVEEVKQIIDITSRVDERVKMIAEAQQQINFRLNHFIDEHNALVAKVQVIESKSTNKFPESLATIDEKVMKSQVRLDVLENLGSTKSQKLADEVNTLKSKVEKLEEHKNSLSERFKMIFGYVWQGLFIVLICYILYRLGLNTPPIP